jgi:hypothetical protein
MQRKRKIITEEDLPPQDAAEQTEPPAPSLEMNQDDIHEFFGKFGNEFNVRCFRLRDNDGKLVYVGGTTPDEASYEWVQSKFGEGKYYLRLVDAKGTYKGQRTVFIAAPPDDAEKETATEAAQLLIPPGIDPMMTYQFQMMQEQFRANQELMIRLIERNQQPQSSGGITELVTALGALKNMSAPPPDNRLDSMLLILQKGIDIGLTGSADGKTKEGGIMGIVREVAPLVGEALRSFTRPGAPITANPPQVETRVQDQISNVPVQPDLAPLKAGIAFLKGDALRGVEPEIWIDWLSRHLDNPQWAPFVEYIHLPYAEFVKLDPDLAKPPFQAFFESILSGLKEMFNSSESEETHGPSPNRAGVESEVEKIKEIENEIA